MKKILFSGLILLLLLLTGCNQQIMSEQDINEVSISDCQNIDNINTKDICYQDVAIAKQDISICELISEENQHSGIGSKCYSEIAKLKKDPSLCDDLPDYLSDECYLGAAVGKVDAEICEKILYSVTRDDCYLGVASLTKDSSLCSKIIRNSDRERCLAITG